jgi:hypothetical protein
MTLLQILQKFLVGKTLHYYEVKYPMPSQAMNIYFINAEMIYPVGDAGAVVIADNPEEALQLTKGLKNPAPPIHIGVAAKHFTTAQVVFINTTDY